MVDSDFTDVEEQGKAILKQHPELRSIVIIPEWVSKPSIVDCWHVTREDCSPDASQLTVNTLQVTNYFLKLLKAQVMALSELKSVQMLEMIKESLTSSEDSNAEGEE